MAEMPVHPFAEIFPMMSPPEFADLVADIKANGLINPVTLDAEGRVLDGRNRLSACSEAGIEPRFVKCDPDVDPLSVLVSLNVKRRNLSAAQKAIAAADAWVQAEAEGRVETKGGDRKSKAQSAHLIADPRNHFGKLFGVGEKYVTMARDLLLHDRVAARAVRDGTGNLRAAHHELGLRIGRQKTTLNHVRDLERKRPDFAERGQAEQLTSDEAFRIAAKDVDERTQQRRTATVNLVDAVSMLDRDADQAPEIARLFDRSIEEQRHMPKVTKDRLRRVAAYIAALIEVWES
jgi:hypothetical protein